MTVIRLAPPPPQPGEPTLDLQQMHAVQVAAQGRCTVITGGPGTGKTSVAVRIAADAAARGIVADRVLLVTPTRAAAGVLRNRLARAMGQAASVPMARAATGVAFAILDRLARDLDQPRPTLITGAEQDVILRILLEGRAAGRAAPLDWGDVVAPEATVLPGFREELRNLLMRVAEAGLSWEQLRDLGMQTGRQEWVAAAEVYREYVDVMALQGVGEQSGQRYDPAAIATEAALALEQWEQDPGTEKPRWDVVVVDDAQDLTAATAALMRQLERDGAQLVYVGNADESVQGYRGAVAGLLAEVVAQGAQHVELASSYRQCGPVLAVAAAVVGGIGVKGVGSARQWAREAVEGGQARAYGVEAGSSVEVMTASHRYGQSRAIAARLRRAHHGFDAPAVKWSQMAVIARSSATLQAVRADLLAADIPCESLGDAVALHLQPAVAALVAILRAALSGQWDEDDAVSLLTSRLVGLDPVGLRRLRRELVREERAGGGFRHSGDLLVEALGDPARLASLSGPEAAAARRLARAVAAARSRAAQALATPGAVLWAAWEALDVAAQWRNAAIAGSIRDDADLDAVIDLFRKAQHFSERLPQAQAMQFLDYLADQDVAQDSLGARGQAGEVVSFVTPAAAAGREWDLVVVAGVEEGQWPNLTLRDSVLGAQRLAEAVRDGLPGAAERAVGPADLRSARAGVLDDEARAFLVAITRARKQMIVTAVEDQDAQASRFVAAVEQAAGISRDPQPAAPPVADLRSAVAWLRVQAHAAADPTPYAHVLAYLARHGVPGADPDQWHGAHEPSTLEPMWAAGEPVRVSPSKVESVQRCTLRWALEAVGGTPEAGEAQQRGSLVHAIAEDHPFGGAEEIMADFEQRWAQEHGVQTWPERVDYARVKDMVTRLAGYLDARQAALEGAQVLTEQRFTVTIDPTPDAGTTSHPVVLSGIADRVEVRDGEAYIVDYKTGASMPTVAEAQTNAQLAMYQLAAELGGIDSVDRAAGAELVYLSSGSAGTRRAQARVEQGQALEQLTRAAELMTQASFPATVNDGCGSCPVRRVCPVHAQGTQVSDS